VVPRRAVDGPLIPVLHACRESFGRPYLWKVRAATTEIFWSLEGIPARMFVSSTAAAAVQHRTPSPASRFPAALLAVFALAPDQAVGVHAFAAAVARAHAAVA